VKTISILTPARKRPQNILRMLDSIKNTKSDENNIEVIFRVDDTDNDLNDPSFREAVYLMTDIRLFPRIVVGPETFPDLGCLWNDCLTVSHGDIFQMGGDDLVYETKDWDRVVIAKFEQFPDGVGLIWCEDKHFSASLATHGFISKKWVETVGWFTPPIGLTYANDNFLYNLANRLRRFYFIGDVTIEHKWDGSNPNDPNYGRMGFEFDRSHEILSNNIGQDCMKEAETKLRGIMK